MEIGLEEQVDLEDITVEADAIDIPFHSELDATVEGDAAKQRHAGQAASDILSEFLEVALHQILHARRLYPAEIFLTRKKYGLPIHISCHPGLNEYITKALSSLRPLLQKNKICHLSLLVKEENDPKENFVFEIQVFQAICKEQSLTSLEQSLRSFLLKIKTCPGILQSPSTCRTFEILVGCSADCEVELNFSENRDMQWTKVDKIDFDRPIQPRKLIPIKALTDSVLFTVQLLVETLS